MNPGPRCKGALGESRLRSGIPDLLAKGPADRNRGREKTLISHTSSGSMRQEAVRKGLQCPKGGDWSGEIKPVGYSNPVHRERPDLLGAGEQEDPLLGSRKPAGNSDPLAQSRKGRPSSRG